jgi:photosystem II stability/assembly factor-like uncharacterized protein
VVGGVAGGGETVTVIGESPAVDVQNARRVIFIPLWQLRGTLVQRSLDDGRTWTTEFEAPRTVLGGSTPSSDIGWFVGVRGLIVRRVGAMWSLANAPANVDVVSVQATDDRAATVTLADGRIFATTDAGVTWTQR